jgi:hypothetical protein
MVVKKERAGSGKVAQQLSIPIKYGSRGDEQDEKQL